MKIPCTNDCGVEIQRNKLTSHLQSDCPKRHTSCIFCGYQGIYEYVTGEHCETCVDALLCCPIEDCTEMLKKCDMSTHIDVCPHSIINCDYQHYGCDLPVKRKELTDHYKLCIDLHLRLTVAKVEQLEVSLTKVQSLVQDEKRTNKEIVAHNDERLKWLQWKVTLIILSLLVAIILVVVVFQNKH